MGLIKCPDCEKLFSDRIAACPQCGCPIDAVQRIECIYYFNYTNNIGFYDSFRECDQEKLVYLGLAISTPTVHVNASPVRFLINRERSKWIKNYVEGKITEMKELEEAVATKQPEYFLVCYDDETKKYYEYDEEFYGIFEKVNEHAEKGMNTGDSEYSDTNVPARDLMVQGIHSYSACRTQPQPQAKNSKAVESKPKEPNVKAEEKKQEHAQLGMKWYNFFMKVRPWITFVMTILYLIGNFGALTQILNREIYGDTLFLMNLLLIVGMGVSAVLQVILLVKADGEAGALLQFIKGILIFDLVYTTFSTIMENLYKGSSTEEFIIIALIQLVGMYFLWYRINVKYFQKRLISQTPKVKAGGKKGGKILINVIIAVILTISVGFNVILCLVCDEFGNDVEQLENNISKLEQNVHQEKLQLEKELRNCYTILYDYNRMVVFVEDDGTRFYHRYECEKFVGDAYWAYNKEAAESKGYKPCDICFPHIGVDDLGFMDEFAYLRMEAIVGEDHFADFNKGNEFSPEELSHLEMNNIVFVGTNWKGLYHRVTCERLSGSCEAFVISMAEANGYRPCPNCNE